MKKRLIFALVMVLCLSLAFFGACNPEEEEKPEEPITITEALTQTNNTQVYVKGVVYAIANDTNSIALFINDGTGNLVVRQSSVAGYAVGDKVTVRGSINPTTATIKAKDSVVEKVGISGTALTPTEKSVEDIVATSSTATNVGSYVKVTARIAKSGTQIILHNGNPNTEYLIVDCGSSFFEEFIGKEVTTQVVLSGYDTGAHTWNVSFCGVASDIQEVLVTIDEDMKGAIVAEAGLSTEENYAWLYLPTIATSYAEETSVRYAWSVKSSDVEGIISIENNQVTINNTLASGESANVVLTLELTSLNTVSQDFPVTIKAVEEMNDFDAIKSATFAENEYIKVSGKVVAFGADEDSAKVENAPIIIALQDANGKLIRLTVDGTHKEEVVLGATVTATGIYQKSDYYYYQIASVVDSTVAITAPEEAYVADYSNAVELTAENFAEFVANRVANTPTLIKIVNPYFVLSGNTSYSYVLFDVTKNGTKTGYTTKDYDGNTVQKVTYEEDGVTVASATDINITPCFGITQINSIFENFVSAYSIPTKNAGAKQYNGLTIYAYALTSGETRWQFIVPEASAFSVDEQAYVDAVAGADIPAFVNSTMAEGTESAEFELPTTIGIVSNVTWTLSNGTALAVEAREELLYEDAEKTIPLYEEDGETQQKTIHYFAKYLANASGEVTITATYEVAGNVKTQDFTIIVDSTIPQAKTLSEATGKVAALTATVTGLVAGHGGSAATLGIILTDGTNLATLSNIDKLADLSVDFYQIKIGEHAISAGDELVLTNVTYAEGKITASSFTNIYCTGSNSITTNLTADITITNAAELAEFVGSADKNVGKLVKVVATEENPIYAFTVQKYYIGFDYDNTNTTGYANAYNTNKGKLIFGAHSAQLAVSVGADWVLANLPQGALPGLTSTDYANYKKGSGTSKFVGEFYLYIEYIPTSQYNYVYTSVLSAGFSLFDAEAETKAIAELDALNTAEVSATEAGELNLPTSTAHASNIVWTVDADHASLITIADGKGAFEAQTADQEITLTATYEVGTKTGLTKSYTISLKAAEIQAITVTEALTACAKETNSTGTVTKMKAYVASIASTAAASTSEVRSGLILTDGVNTIYYSDAVYTVGEHELVVGDEVIISAATLVSTTTKHIMSGGTFELGTAGTIDYTNLNAITISNEAELVAWAKTSEPGAGIAIKFTGTFYWVGTGKTSTTSTCRIQLTYRDSTTLKGSANARYAFADAADGCDTSKDSGCRTISFNTKGNVPVLGANWWTSISNTAIPEAGMGSAVLSTYGSTGTLYAVAGYYSNTMQAFNIINASGFNVTPKA